MKIEATSIGGGAYERGRAHGRALRPLIEGHIAAWLGSFAEAKLGDPQSYVEALLRESDFRAATAEHASGLLEEVDGIADGAGLPRKLVFALQLLDEEWAFRARRTDTRGPQKCSSLAIVPGRGPTWIGQNMDLGGYTDGWQALLRIEADAGRPAALVFTIAGMIGLMGANAAGLGVCVNSLPQLPSRAQGVPVAFVVRRLLECRGLEEAAGVVLSIPHATNQHYLIVEAGAARSFEASAAGVREYRPADPGRFLHTNHPLTEVQGAPEAARSRENSVARLQSLQRRLSAGRADLAEIEGALCSADDPRHPVRRPKSPAGGLIGFTTGSMISALRGARADIDAWVSAGPPDVGGYSRFVIEAEPCQISQDVGSG